MDKVNESLEIIEKLTRNVVSAPRDEKFRKLKLSNRKIAETITDVPGALDVLREMGWTEGPSEAGPTLILPASVRLAFEDHVVKIIDAKDHFKKEHENERRRRSREERDADDPEKRRLKEQLEQDRLERDAASASQGPSRDSVAQKLGDGANVVRAKDLGIGQSQGG